MEGHEEQPLHAQLFVPGCYLDNYSCHRRRHRHSPAPAQARHRAPSARDVKACSAALLSVPSQHVHTQCLQGFRAAWCQPELVAESLRFRASYANFASATF